MQGDESFQHVLCRSRQPMDEAVSDHVAHHVMCNAPLALGTEKQCKISGFMQAGTIRLLDNIFAQHDVTVSLWLCDLDRLAREPDISSFLSESDRQWTKYSRFDIHRGRHLASRYFEHTVLATALHIRPMDVQIERTSEGKPFLRGSEFHYSLSHSEGIAVMALGAQELGIDIEHLRCLPDVDDLARRMLPAEDANAIAQLPPSQRSARFLEHWTLREAVLKATGVGLQAKMHDLVLQKLNTRILVMSGGKRWRLLSFQPIPDVIGALAVQE